NQNITIKNIPSKAFEYKINGKSAIDWIIDRYQISIDKKSLIENNPNDYQGGKYIYELLLKIIDLSIKSVDLINEISKMECE
ncbi:type ISP restriction/modification enzyme, partial [Campylobacter jejuni]